MIPDNVLSTEPVIGQFLFPHNLSRTVLTEDYEMGGIALQDISHGHNVQAWYFHWDPLSTNVYTRPGVTGTDIFLHTATNVFEYCAAFDQNMRWIDVCTNTSGVTVMRWYDPTIPGYTTTTFTDVASCRITLDDNRETQITAGVTDVLLTYVKPSTGQLCLRAQRDRWTVEYILHTFANHTALITHFGMANRYRVQWRARYRTLEEKIPWLP